MLYNLLIDWDDQTNESGINEPLTVEEVKNYLRLEGFIDQSDSIPSDFNDDDAIIETLIRSARERIEEFTGLSLIPKIWEIEFTNLAGGFEIPFGPVTTIINVKDDEGDSISTDDFEVSLNGRILKWPKYENMTMLYEAGYVSLPKGLKDAMYKEVAYRYINRGDENVDGMSREAMNLASRYKTTNWLG
jgi:uncharacterized phiE125 gp8 family phage protein